MREALRVLLKGCGLLVVFWLSAANPLSAATLSDSNVDAYNVRVGTQTFSGLYQFSTNTLLVETANVIRDLGSDILKMYLGPNYPDKYRITLPPNVTNLLSLARDEPSCRQVLNMPFRHYVMWTYPFASWWPFDGYSSGERTGEYKEFYDLTCYLLTNYNNSGKTFYLGHWEGDWYMLPKDTNGNYITTTNPTPAAIQGFIDWMNNRQKAVDDARSATRFTNVNVYCYLEANRVLDARSGNTNSNQRAINKVVPYVTNLDFLSWSSYDGQNLPSNTLYSTLTYMQSQLPTSKAASISGSRIWIGEYAWGSTSTDAQEPMNRAYIQRLLGWGPRFILYWEIYNNETNDDGSLRHLCLVDEHNTKVASWYLHQRFLNNARLLSARFQETNGRLPNDQEFGALTAPILWQPLPPPINLDLRNAGALPLSSSAAQLWGTLSQGVYGDDCARVSVFWGRQDGGTNRLAWEQSRYLGLNTNFNPTTFTCVLSNLVPYTNYFFRFYATNASGEAWAPASAQWLDPQRFGSRLKISFNGYTRSRPLANFPVLVSLGTDLPGFAYSQFLSPSGGDLRFTDASGGQLLNHEIDEWNTNGVSTVWVQVPLLAGTNDCIWAYWGNPTATNLPACATNGSVFSQNFELVWHLKESGWPYADSTLKHPALTGNPPTLTSSGLVGHGAAFNGTSDYLSAGAVNLGDQFTLSAWVKVEPAATNIQALWANKAGGYANPGLSFFVDSYLTRDKKLLLETGNGSSGSTANTDTNAVSFGQWHHLAATVDRALGTVGLYVDGVESTLSSSARTDFANATNLFLGALSNRAYFFKGTLDEARVETRICSPDWLWASWMTVASNSVLSSYSSVQRPAPALASARATDGGLSLHWPAGGFDYKLYSATNLAAPVAWTLVTNPVALTGSQYQLTLPPPANGPRYYRLQAW